MAFHCQGHEAGDPGQRSETCLPEGQTQSLSLSSAEPVTPPQDAHLALWGGTCSHAHLISYIYEWNKMTELHEMKESIKRNQYNKSYDISMLSHFKRSWHQFWKYVFVEYSRFSFTRGILVRAKQTPYSQKTCHGLLTRKENIAKKVLDIFWN